MSHQLFYLFIRVYHEDFMPQIGMETGTKITSSSSFFLVNVLALYKKVIYHSPAPSDQARWEALVDRVFFTKFFLVGF